jgi:hypothetical protein
MFGFGNRNQSAYRRNTGIGGVFMGGGLRRAAVMGLGMMAYRWWRNRRAGGPAGQRGTGGQGWNAQSDVAGRPMTQW